MIEQGGQMRERRAVAEPGLDRVETRTLKATNQIGVGRHAPIVAAGASSMVVNESPESGSSAVNSLNVAVAIGQALSASGLSHKQACAWMEIDPGLWSRQLQGEGHISFQRLLKLPVKFWTEFVPLLAEPIGLSVTHEDIADRALMQCVASLDAIVRTVTQMRRAQRRSA